MHLANFQRSQKINRVGNLLIDENHDDFKKDLELCDGVQLCKENH